MVFACPSTRAISKLVLEDISADVVSDMICAQTGNKQGGDILDQAAQDELPHWCKYTGILACLGEPGIWILIGKA